MKKIDVVQENYKVLTALDGADVLATMVYTKWYSNKALVTLADKKEYVFQPCGFWQTKFDVLANNLLVLQVVSKWNGTITIVKPGDTERPYMLKHRGFFKNGYMLLNYKDEVLLEVVSNFSWKKMYPGYTLGCADSFGNDDFDKILMMLSLHHLRLFQNSASASST